MMILKRYGTREMQPEDWVAEPAQERVEQEQEQVELAAEPLTV